MTACACDEFSTNVTFRQSTIYGSATTPNVGRAFMYYDEPLRDALVLLGPGNTNFAALSTEVEPTADGVARRAIVIRTQDPANPATALERARFSSKPHPNLRLGNRHLPGTSGRLALETSNLSLGGSTAWEWFTDQPITNTYDLYLRENTGVPAITVTSGTGRIGIARTDPVARLDIQGGGTSGSETDAERGIRLTAATVDMRLFADMTKIGAGFLGTKSQHRLSFYTHSDGAADYRSATKMTILANGNVGIGVETPQGRLTIGDQSAPGSDGRIRLAAAALPPSLAARTWEVGPGPDASLSCGFSITDISAGAVRLFITPDAAGNVGIGKTDPQTKLDVAGTINAASGITSGGQIYASGTGNASRVTARQFYVVGGSGPTIDSDGRVYGAVYG